MKIKIFYIVFPLVLLLLNSCGDVAPTELLLDDNNTLQNEYDVELISDTPNGVDYSNGYDSTGVVTNPKGKGTIISVSGVKNTIRNITTHKLNALTIFYDKSKPVYSPRGKHLGYRTFALGDVFFNSERTKKRPLRAKFSAGGVRRDTLLGFFFLLNKWIRPGMPGIGNPYDKSIRFRYLRLGTSVQFDIPTPPQINASVTVHGNFGDNDFRVRVKWDRSDVGKIELILGAIIRGNKDVIPLYKIKIRDKGGFVIPPTLLKKIPYRKLDYLVITLMRKIVTEGTSAVNSNDYYISAQSIHNIFVQIK